MKPSLILQPLHTNSADILKNFVDGKPLTLDQINFLERQKGKINSALFDPIYKYYIDAEKKRRKFHGTFLMPSEEINEENSKLIKKRIQLFLQQKNQTGVSLKVTTKQLLTFKQACAGELIFYHGNQFLTGAPFYPGAIPPVILFQWGNLFGVVKYVILAEEKAMKANTLIYFEDMQERDLNRCVADYEIKLKDEFKLQNTLLQEHKLEPEEYNKFLIKTPIFTPSLRPIGVL